MVIKGMGEVQILVILWERSNWMSSFFSTILSKISNYVVTCLLKPQPFAIETGYNCFDCDAPYFMLHIRSVFSQFDTLVFMQDLDFAYEACDGRRKLYLCYLSHLMDFRSPTGVLLTCEVMLLRISWLSGFICLVVKIFNCYRGWVYSLLS